MPNSGDDETNLDEIILLAIGAIAVLGFIVTQGFVPLPQFPDIMDILPEFAALGPIGRGIWAIITTLALGSGLYKRYS